MAHADAIAEQLAGLYRELVTGEPDSRVAGVPLSGADASGRAARLYLFQCDSDDLVLVSTFRRWWEADARGFRWVERWPLTRELVASERFGVEFPYVRFATNGRRVRFGMSFGPQWYVVREGPLGPDGQFDPADLIGMYPCRADEAG
jgi:hypothetical protein